MKTTPAIRFGLIGLALLAPSVSAQTDSVEHQDLSRGLTLPPLSVSTVEQATAAAVNPAGIALTGGPELLYWHERAIGRNRVGDGLYFATPLMRWAGAGVSVEWLRSSNDVDYRKTTWSFALGNPLLALGVGLNLFSSADDAALDGLASLHLGVTSRPLRFLALGATIRNVDAPRVGTLTLPREYQFGIAFRPFQERYTLSADYLFGDARGFLGGRMSYALGVEVYRGIALSAGLSHGVRGGDPLFFQVGATVNTHHLGASYVLGGGPGGLTHLAGLRASWAPYSALQFGGVIGVVDLDDLLSSKASPALALLGISAADPFVAALQWLDRAARAPELAGLVVKISRIPGLGLPRAMELRAALLRLREARKRVVAVLLSAEDPEYFVATGAERIFAAPQATVLVNGFSAHATFLGGTMDMLGVQWDVARVGPYKSAPDALTRKDLSPEQRESLGAFLDVQASVFEQEVAAARGISLSTLRGALAQGFLHPQKARELGLVDELVQSDRLDMRLADMMPGARVQSNWKPVREKPHPWGRTPRIAVIPVIGSIAGGKSRIDPLGLQRVAGAETVVAALEKATNDPMIDAIVLRIDSGGGDGLASDLMYRAVWRARRQKPVVASMGDVAASGGYYVAAGAHEVFALPSTLTGSIGVFVVKPALRGLGAKLGVSRETLRHSNGADIFDFWDPWTPEQAASAQEWAAAFYAEFVQEVASSRNLTPKQVDAAGRGRIWSGNDAKARGLVDTLGGLNDALWAARKRARIAPGADVEVVILGEPRSWLGELATEGSALGGVVSAASALIPTGGLTEPLPAAAHQALHTLGVAPEVLFDPGTKALLPFSVQMR
ncbi:MAG: S49 family peptidase [Myxococcaceae bacterium]